MISRFQIYPLGNHTLETRQLSVRRILATILVVTMKRQFPETLHNYSTLNQKDKWTSHTCILQHPGSPSQAPCLDGSVFGLFFEFPQRLSISHFQTYELAIMETWVIFQFHVGQVI